MPNNRFSELNAKIQRVLNSEEVKTDNEIISFYELASSCEEEMRPYNDFLYTDMEIVAKRLNLKSKIKNMLGKKVPYIKEVIPTITDEGKCYVRVNLIDSNYYSIGSILIKKQDLPEFENISKETITDDFVAFVGNCDSEFKDEAIVLEGFKQNHPDISYKWDVNHPDPKSVYNVSDGFIGGRIDLNNSSTSKAMLTNIEDIHLATMHTKNYGVLYDYIDFYNDYIQKRIAINVNDLNPLMKSIVSKQLNLGEAKQLILK